MAYFAKHYSQVALPIGGATEQGLRNAQLGAIHAVASHFTLHHDPALVVMPTGSGKTLVLLTCAFLLRAERVLIVTPSRLVRNQISRLTQSLATLKDLAVLPSDLAGPKVCEVKRKLASDSDWEALASFDVVVGVPASISPASPGVAENPPSDLFDLVIIDEAHHTPASTWVALLHAFPAARKILFTATPFRLDEREIPGTMVYNYPLRRAYEDGVFGQIEFLAVEPGPGVAADVALARRAAEILRADQAQGFEHRLMVRTDRRSHAQQLEKVYLDHTDLHLRLIHSGHSSRHVDQSVALLQSGQLDGILCVDMLGEGFDYPPLKIASVHRKHKSLAVTLQFVGRFARTGKEKLGKAKFLAVPEEIQIEQQRLYREGAVWQEIITGMHAAVLGRDERLRQDLKKFDPPAPTGFDLGDLSLSALEPLSHVKIYQVTSAEVDIDREIALPPPFEVAYRQASKELSTVVLISREATTPDWTELELFDRVEYDLFVVYYHRDPPLLFVNASRRSTELYEEIATQYTGGGHRILPLYKLNRILRGLSALQCFNVGMRNRQQSLKTESYRIIAGRQAEASLAKTDGRLFHRGHVFARAETDAGGMTLGYSSASKVWSSESLKIPDLIAWCRELAENIKNAAPFSTGTNLDFLPEGQELVTLPLGVLAADWDEDAYKRSLKVASNQADGVATSRDLLDCEWEIDQGSITKRGLTVVLDSPGLKCRVDYSLDHSTFFTVPADQPEVVVVSHKRSTPLADYLNQRPLSFYTADFSRFRGEELFAAPEGPFTAFDTSRFETKTTDWQEAGVNIKLEFAPGEDPAVLPSLQGWLLEELLGQSELVFYDHRPGEMADFVAIACEGLRMDVTFYHVKASSEPKAGIRTKDVYDVCGQVIKSVVWATKAPALLKRMERREKTGSRWAKGNLPQVQRLLGDPSRRLAFHIALVQPGLSASGVAASAEIQEILAATDDYVRRAVAQPLRILASA